MKQLYEPSKLAPEFWEPHVVVAATLWGEARGEPVPGRIAVVWTIRNRVLRPRWWGRTWAEVCLKRSQYSCWNPGDPNRAKLSDPLAFGPPEAWLEALAVAVLVMSGGIPDPTGGATHYHTRQVRPDWASRLRPLVEIGNHLFYRED